MVKVCEGLLNPHTLEPTGLETIKFKDPVNKENRDPGKLTHWILGQRSACGPVARKNARRPSTSLASHKRKILKLNDLPKAPFSSKEAIETIDSTSTALLNIAREGIQDGGDDILDAKDCRTETKDAVDRNPGLNQESWATNVLDPFVNPTVREDGVFLQKPRLGLGLSKKSVNLARISELVEQYKHAV
eukprot:Gregarina_sp_Poly_1__11009@NODE_876_length_5898_cov_31_387584_g516_i1_p2_GENE_NODE_876_length_5898_cov_31_387584_g516_i1NODE_876_length_5898_cov_31_387584_g516_i1_p2_ORF_typecomplete_len189_score37_11_NODE_876_length_5898_cov_31_387584_g516_i1215781